MNVIPVTTADKEPGKLMKFSKWKRFIESSEPADRSEAADTVPENGKTSEITRLLLKCLNDEKSLVRTCALDTLHLFGSDTVASKIRRHMKRERDPLARAYGARSLALIGRAEDISVVYSLIKKPNHAIVRANAAYGLLSKFLHLTMVEILSCCNHKDEDTRSMGFGLLHDIVLESFDELQEARKAAYAYRSSDEPRVTKDRIADLLKIIPKPASRRAAGSATRSGRSGTRTRAR
jgi:HEAT repeat protein